MTIHFKTYNCQLRVGLSHPDAVSITLNYPLKLKSAMPSYKVTLFPFLQVQTCT